MRTLARLLVALTALLAGGCITNNLFLSRPDHVGRPVDCAVRGFGPDGRGASFPNDTPVRPAKGN